MGRLGLAWRPQTQLGFFSTVSHRDEASDSNGVAYIKGKAEKGIGQARIGKPGRGGKGKPGRVGKGKPGRVGKGRSRWRKGMGPA